MKKLTPNQQKYQKEIKRIRTNLSKLRRQGYDVSELAKRYTTKLPNRVTSKMLQELHAVTPKKLKSQAEYVAYAPQARTPLTTKPTDYPTVLAPNQFPTFKPKSDFTYIPPVPTSFMDLPSILPDLTDETTEETAPDEQPEETPEEQHLTQQIVDQAKGKVLTIDIDTGEILEEADLYIEEDEEGNEYYINGDTGEIVGENKFAKYNIPDMNEYAMEMLYDIVNQFPLNYQQPMKKALDKMIEEKGLSAVADAFTQTMNNRPNMLDKLSNAHEKYNEAVALLEEMADILDIPLTLKQDIKDYVYRESMADIEEYGT